MANEKRIEELTKKRVDSGLSDAEADELGRLFAEQEGKPYSNAKLSKAPPGEQGADVPVQEEYAVEPYLSAEEEPNVPPPGDPKEKPSPPAPGSE
jgi:hypothetical protein